MSSGTTLHFLIVTLTCGALCLLDCSIYISRKDNSLDFSSTLEAIITLYKMANPQDKLHQFLQVCWNHLKVKKLVTSMSRTTLIMATIALTLLAFVEDSHGDDTAMP